MNLQCNSPNINSKPSIAILGTRGIPAQHGGFETFAEHLALYLAKKGWNVTVYCPAYGVHLPYETEWCGIRLLHLPLGQDNAVGTIIFDWKSTLHAVKERVPVLNLGYGTALFGFFFRLFRCINIVNMDGIEWRRKKWSFPARIWLYANERFACWFANHLIADHPEIARHLATRAPTSKITMIPYGADTVTGVDPSVLASLGLKPDNYVLVVARPDPDNSILEIVEAFCCRPRSCKLVVLGAYNPTADKYHRRVIEAANSNVLFPGGIYEKQTVEALRFHCCLYIHGHQVGGTNPSLVEALAAGSPVLAHDNPYNRWVLKDAGCFFSTQGELVDQLDILLADSLRLKKFKVYSRDRHRTAFEWDGVLKQYEELFTRFQTNFDQEKPFA